MKRHVSIALFIISACLMPLSGSAEFKKTKIAVLDFQLQGRKHDSADMGKIVAEWLITALVKEGRFDVIERRLLEKVLEEQKMGVSGLVDESSASRLGRVLGAKIVITGSVMEFQGVVEANARIIEVETSSIIAAENVKSTNAAKLEDLVYQMAEKIIRDFPLEGYVVLREGGNVLIDLGKRTGVKPGMQFIVYREGKIIRHPKTGEVLDIERIETGTIEISEVKNKTADARIVKENGADSIVPNQMVKSTLELISAEPDKRRNPSVYISEGALSSKLTSLDVHIAELRRVKINGGSDWKKNYKAIDGALDALERTYKNSPEVYLSRARSLEAIDRIDHAEKYIRKALSVHHDYPAAYALRGDIYVWDAGKPKPAHNKGKNLKLAVDAYEDALKYAQNKDFEALIFLKMGDAYDLLSDDSGREKATEFWKKALAAGPASATAKTAGERLNQ